MINGFPLSTANVLADPALDTMARKAAESNKSLVIIQLNGGNDGLNMVLPIQQWTSLLNARSNILVPESSVLGISHNDTIGFHPSMQGIRSLAEDKLLTVIQGVSYPNPNFSHFRATDIWMSGSSSDAILTTGWLARVLKKKYPTFPDSYPNDAMPDPLAINIGSTLPFSLQGEHLNYGYSTVNPESLMEIVNDVSHPAPETDYGFELEFLRMMKEQSNVYSQTIKKAYQRSYDSNVTYPTDSLGQQLKMVARLINGGLKTPVFVVMHPKSFDTHEFQVESGSKLTGKHAENLQILSNAINAFQRDLIHLNKADSVVGMTFSEFGRRIKSNDSMGTDHGVGAPVLFFGAALNPIPSSTSAMKISGMIGDAPVIPEHATVNDQVQMQFDYRQVYATVMQHWLDMSPEESESVLGGKFELLPIFYPEPELLPIELIQFTARLEDRTTILDWATASELNNNHFNIQRSEDAINFSNIGKVKGQGTTNERNYYQYSDLLTKNGTFYYRLQQVDDNGTSTYSPIVSVSVSSEEQFLIYPNPAQDYIHFKTKNLEGNTRIQIIQSTGQVLIEHDLPNSTQHYSLDIRALPKGQYFMRIISPNHQIVQYFIKGS